MAKDTNKTNNTKKKVLIGLVTAVTIIGVGLGIFLAKVKGKDNLNVHGDNGINNEQIVDGDDNTIPGDNNGGNVQETYTEAEYKAMAIEKLEEVVTEAHNNYKNNIRSGRLVSNFKIAKIDKENAYIYGYGDIAEFGDNSFITAVLKDETLLKDCKSNKDVVQKTKNLTYENVENTKAEQNLNQKMSSDIYNNFLDSVVKDEGFRIALENEGITFSEDVTAWEELATVVNAKIYSNQNIEVSFIDFAENKTVTVRVRAGLSLQESSNAERQVKHTTEKDKEYTIVNLQDFSTFEEIVPQQVMEFGK